MEGIKKNLIYFCFLLCFALVWFWLPNPVGAANASLYLLPSSGIYSIGNTFSVGLKVNTGGAAINAAEGSLVFSTDKLEVVSLSKAGSIFTLWTSEPGFSNSDGTISFGGGLSNPGYSGAAGSILTVKFLVKISGTAMISFSSGAVLANDGQGTNILASLGNGNYTFQVGAVTPPAPLPTPSGVPYPPEITSPTHSDPGKWYNSKNPEFKWDLASDVSGASVLLNDKPTSNPGPNSDGVFNSKKYENLSDGIWYLHLKLKNQAGWSQISHFRIQIDTQPPLPFEIKIKESAETDNPRPTLFFETSDEVSGLFHYEIKVGEGDIYSVSKTEVEHNPYQMPLQAPGKHTVVVSAIDKASNSTLAMTTVNILPIASPLITDYSQSLKPGDILVFKGTALPEATVLVYVQQRGEEPIVQQVQGNREGQWSYVYDQPVEGGIYKIWAQTIDQRGAQSLPSEKITIDVSQLFLIRIGNLIVEHLTIIISILMFLTLLVLGSLYSWLKIKLFLKKLRKETKEAEEALHRAFELLKDEVESQLKLLDKVKSKRELTTEETKIRSNLRKNLNVAEKYIEKEIKDIEKKISFKGRLKDYFDKYFRK